MNALGGSGRPFEVKFHADGFLVCTDCGMTGKPLENDSLKNLDACECGGMIEGFKVMGDLTLRAVFVDPVDLSAFGIDLPGIVVDDDFLEFLEEESAMGASLEFDEFAELWVQWLEENVE